MFKHKNRVFSLLLIGALSFLLESSQEPALAQAAKPTNQPTLGQRIGSTVKDAISSAFPGVSGIAGLIDAIWKKKPNNGKNVTKDQLSQATTNAQSDIKKQIVAQAQEKLTPLAEVADELQIVSLFGVPTVTASENVVRMAQRLKSGKALGDKEWAAERQDWDVAKAQLQTIKNAPDLQKVQDLWLRDKLSQIQRANNDKVIRIDDELKSSAPDTDALSKNLDDLFFILGDISAAIGYEVSNMQADLKGLSDWAKGAAGPGKTPLSPEGQTYVDFLNRRYK